MWSTKALVLGLLLTAMMAATVLTAGPAHAGSIYTVV